MTNFKLVGTAGTGFFYVTSKNPRNVPQKLNLKKVYKPKNQPHTECVLTVFYLV